MTLTAEMPGWTACKPRFSTPRDERFPTLGPAVGEVARRLGRPLMPWQQDLMDVAYEYDPDSRLLRYNEIDVTVPRQSGKTTATLAKKVYRLTAMARQLGPQRSTYTAQKRLNARKKLERDFAELLRGSRSFREITNAKARPTKASEWRLSLNNGSEAIQFGTGSFLQIDTPSRTGGHGDTLDDGTIDEAFAHEDDTVEAGMRPAMATRRSAQLWVISTAGDAKSKYLYRKVLAGRAATETGAHGKVCYAEYSAPEDADPGDPATWWGCMPALGITITEDFIQGEWERAQRKGQEGIDMFLRAYLNLWPEIPILGDEDSGGAFDMEAWLSPDLIDTKPTLTAPTFGVATAPDQSWSAICAAWRRPDGSTQILLGDDYRRDSTWVAGRVAELRSRYGARVLVDAASKGLVSDAVETTVTDRAIADNALSNAIKSGTLRHGNEPALNTSVKAACWKSSGDTQVLDPKGNIDISPLRAAALAVHGLAMARPSAYESRGLLTL
jgi:phage terminase large subunit-like protein